MIKTLACLWLLLLAYPLPLSAHTFAPGSLAVVADDGNNLRAQGGPDYKTARILFTLNKGTQVQVLRQEGNWTEVRVGQEERGWVHSKCLIPVEQYLSDPRNKDEVFCPGDYARRFQADLDKDHKQALVLLDDVPTLSGGGGRLVIKDAAGAVLWRGPAPAPKDPMEKWSPLFYFCSPAGVYWPSLIGDIDNDGFAEIVATDAQSDVSVSSFTLARWNGKAFSIIRQGDSLVESAPDSGRYVWNKWQGAYRNARWIMNIDAIEPNGTVSADVYEYGPTLPLRFGKARIKLDAQGATLVRWVTPLGAS